MVNDRALLGENADVRNFICPSPVMKMISGLYNLSVLSIDCVSSDAQSDRKIHLKVLYGSASIYFWDTIDTIILLSTESDSS